MLFSFLTSLRRVSFGWSTISQQIHIAIWSVLLIRFRMGKTSIFPFFFMQKVSFKYNLQTSWILSFSVHVSFYFLFCCFGFYNLCLSLLLFLGSRAAPFLAASLVHPCLFFITMLLRLFLLQPLLCPVLSLVQVSFVVTFLYTYVCLSFADAHIIVIMLNCRMYKFGNCFFFNI